MRKFAAVLLIVAAPVLFADGTKGSKPSKTKEKRFDAVSVSAATVAGSYSGPSESYGLVLELSREGALRGNYVEQGRIAVLNAIVVEGSSFTARASFDDGSSRTIRGSFVTGASNGTRAFGVRLQDVPVDPLGTVQTFFERL